RGRTVEDFINVRDFAPTILELAGVEVPGSVTGASFAGILAADEEGWLDPRRNRMLVGKERHDLGRPNDWGYPVRALRTPEYLYVRNYEPDRWPAGNPETGYRNCDASPTKSRLVRGFDKYYRMSFGKRPAEELYRVGSDPDCVRNLAAGPRHAAARQSLRAELQRLLERDGDPRALGQAAVFDTYEYVGSRRHSYSAWQRHNGS
ncbi:MAG: hypothetical protein OXD30_00415, partial [Bryobacterales bacterium]|nr:hypothetical protein [Bryobacterales bacterium]